MARHKPQTNSRQLAFDRPAFLAISSGRKSECRTPVNAILNYAYAALESENWIKAISEGL
jgi:hypothetical protein